MRTLMVLRPTRSHYLYLVGVWLQYRSKRPPGVVIWKYFIDVMEDLTYDLTKARSAEAPTQGTAPAGTDPSAWRLNLPWPQLRTQTCRILKLPVRSYCFLRCSSYGRSRPEH
jgi:hypothetical protein